MAIFVNKNESEYARTLREAKQRKQREEAEHYRRMIGLDKKKVDKENEQNDVLQEVQE